MSKENKNLLLGISGSIAAYRTPDLVSRFRQEGFNIRTILSKSAQQFVTRTSLACMSRGGVYTDEDIMFESWQPTHIALADWAEIAVIAPATANTIGKLANGLAEGLLCETFMALPSDIDKYISPAMNGKMLTQPSVSRNIEQLQLDGYKVIQPRVGNLACGYVGNGKMASIESIVETVKGSV